MTDFSSFTQFPLLPPELRLKIFSFAHPARILQLGVKNGLPFPCLSRHEERFQSNSKTFSPVPTSLPALFSTCHDSRQICLATYVPFAYTYMHPTQDILYISKKAARRLCENLRGYARVNDLYPVALLDTVAIEFDRGDLPARFQNWNPSSGVARPEFDESSIVIYDICKLFFKFGTPRNVMIVGNKVIKGTNLGHSDESPSLVGYEELELTEDWGQDLEWRQVLLDYVSNQFHAWKHDPWFKWRMPQCSIITSIIRGEVLMWQNGDFLAYTKRVELSKAWVEKARHALGGRRWNWDTDANPYLPENTLKAWERAGLVSNGYRVVPRLSEFGLND